MTVGRVRIAYRDFYDIPRVFVVEWRKRLILFDCSFDDTLDDYPDHFSVYELPMGLAARVTSPKSSWIGLTSRGKFVGRVLVDEVVFDKTRRRSIDDAALRTLKLE